MDLRLPFSSEDVLRKTRNILRIFIPLECPVCGNVPYDGTVNMLCRDCLAGIRFLHAPFCPSCGGEHSGILAVCPDCLREGEKCWDGAYAAFAMTGFLQELLHLCKYRNQPELARVIGDLAFQTVRERLPRVDCIVPVPLHWRRFLRRGFNQAEWIAGRLSAGSGVPAENLLRRIRCTGQQAKLGKKERISNLSHAFFVPDSIKVKKRAILLVDDVMTTGSTLSAAAKALKKAGAGPVYVFCAARRQRM